MGPEVQLDHIKIQQIKFLTALRLITDSFYGNIQPQKVTTKNGIHEFTLDTGDLARLTFTVTTDIDFIYCCHQSMMCVFIV